MCFPLSAYATQDSITIITDHQAQHHYKNIISSIKKRLTDQSEPIKLHVLNHDDDLIENSLHDNNGCIITLGTQSFERINSQNYTPNCSLSLLISRSHFYSSSVKLQKSASAIFINQPLQRISSVLRRTLKYAQKASIVVSNQWTEDLDIKNTKIDLYIKYLSPSDSITQAFRDASKGSDFVIAVPDPNIYNQSNIKNILLTTYKAKTPLIGYSEALSRAGALISIYTPAEHLGKQAAEWLIQGQRKTSSFPKYFKVKLNKKVAKSLNIKFKNEVLFEQKIWIDDNE